jgi:hypothetical protein
MKDRHTGEGRYPGLARPKQLDPGLRRGDEFKHLRAGSIICMIDQKRGIHHWCMVRRVR